MRRAGRQDSARLGSDPHVAGPDPRCVQRDAGAVTRSATRRRLWTAAARSARCAARACARGRPRSPRPASRSSTAAPPRAKTGVGTSSTCDGPRSFRRFVTGPRTADGDRGRRRDAARPGNGRSVLRRCSARPDRRVAPHRLEDPGAHRRAHSHRRRRAARRARARSRRSCASLICAVVVGRSRSCRASRRSRPTRPQARAARRRRRCTGRADGGVDFEP